MHKCTENRRMSRNSYVYCTGSSVNQFPEYPLCGIIRENAVCRPFDFQTAWHFVCLSETRRFGIFGFPAGISTLNQRWINVALQRWINVEFWLHMKVEATLKLQRCFNVRYQRWIDVENWLIFGWRNGDNWLKHGWYLV